MTPPANLPSSQLLAAYLSKLPMLPSIFLVMVTTSPVTLTLDVDLWAILAAYVTTTANIALVWYSTLWLAGILFVQVSSAEGDFSLRENFRTHREPVWFLVRLSI